MHSLNVKITRHWDNPEKENVTWNVGKRKRSEDRVVEQERRGG